MIILSKTTADSAGRVALRNYQLSGEYDGTARIDRAKTLDGGSVISHYGVSDTDRELLVDCRMTAAEMAIVKSFYENASVLRISYWDGAFTGYIYRMRAGRDGTARIVFYFSEKLT